VPRDGRNAAQPNTTSLDTGEVDGGMNDDMVQLLGDKQTLHVREGAVVRHLDNDRWTVTHGDRVLMFDLAAPIYQDESGAHFARQLRELGCGKACGDL
jgi:hypothetical protein